jgi:hypothetical protein
MRLQPVVAVRHFLFNNFYYQFSCLVGEYTPPNITFLFAPVTLGIFAGLFSKRFLASHPKVTASIQSGDRP